VEVHICNSSTWKLRQKDKFKASLSYLVRSYLKNREKVFGIKVKIQPEMVEHSGGRGRKILSLRPSWATYQDLSQKSQDLAMKLSGRALASWLWPLAQQKIKIKNDIGGQVQ
jgi:hypothetical protein